MAALWLSRIPWIYSPSRRSLLFANGNPMLCCAVTGDFQHLNESARRQSGYKRHLHTKSSPSTGESTSLYSAFDKLDTSFNNGRESYKSKSNFEICRALLVFNATSSDFLVNRYKTLMKISRKILGKSLFKATMKASFYGQFVAGEDLTTVKPVVEKNLRYGVKAILDYSVEEDLEERAETTKIVQDLASTTDGKVLEAREANSQPPSGFSRVGFEDQQSRKYLDAAEVLCERNMTTFLRCIDVVADATNRTGFTAVKVTALAKPELLLKMSKELVRAKKVFEMLTREGSDAASMRIDVNQLQRKLTKFCPDMSADEAKDLITYLDIHGKGVVHLYDWINLLRPRHSQQRVLHFPGLNTNKPEPLFPLLSEEEQAQVKQVLDCLRRLAQRADEKNIRIMVDAEQTYFQPAINWLTMEMMRVFNKEKAIVFNTYQAYLKEAYYTMATDLEQAGLENFCFAAKVVRGAYMDQERERARADGYEDPINPTIDATAAMYEKVMDKVMSEAVRRPLGRVTVMAATHNEDAVRSVVQRMKDYGIQPSHEIISFGQLLGMCDHVSFPLGQSGFPVYKYVPFGPVEEVLPYLSRRALENRGFFQKVKKERALLLGELLRRLSKGTLLYRPPS